MLVFPLVLSSQWILTSCSFDWRTGASVEQCLQSLWHTVPRPKDWRGNKHRIRWSSCLTSEQNAVSDQRSCCENRVWKHSSPPIPSCIFTIIQHQVLWPFSFYIWCFDTFFPLHCPLLFIYALVFNFHKGRRSNPGWRQAIGCCYELSERQRR